MDIISPILHFLTDKTKKITSKAVLICSFIFLLYLVDNLLGFSYYYNNEKKLEQIKTINEVIKDSTLTKELKNNLSTYRDNIFAHRSIKDYLFSFFLNISFSNSKKTTIVNPIKASPIIYNDLIHFLTSSWVIVFVMILFPFFAFKDKSQSFAMALFILLFAEGLFYLLAFLQAKLFGLIPIINNNPTYNYTLNVFLNILIITIFIITSQKKK